MATLKDRLTALEQVHLKARPELFLFYRATQEGEPTPAQAIQIEQAKRTGRAVRIICFGRAEDRFPGFTGRAKGFGL